MKVDYFARAPLLGTMFLAGAVALPGCGKGEIERAAVKGRVSLDGNPIQLGQIRFVPVGQSQGPAWTAWIKEGQYSTEGTKGAAIGELRIEILAYRVPAELQHAASKLDGDDDLPREQFLPAKYNVRSELKMAIAAGSDAVEKNWELTSQ